MSATSQHVSGNAQSPEAPALKAALPAQQAATSDRFDIVVAGAGHNSLITTAYLVKAGYRCLVLEGRPMVGGGVKSAQITLRGFIDDICSSTHLGIQQNPLMRNNELKLGDYGLEYIYPDPIYHFPFSDGSYITQWHDLDRTCAELAKFSKKDAETYRRMLADFEGIAPLFEAITFAPVGFVKPLNEQLAHHPKSKFWQRRLAMSAWDIIRENFEDDHVRCFMMASPWGHMPPEAPMTGRGAYSVFTQQRLGRPLPKGGSGVLTQALARLIEAHGGVILTNKPVQRLIVENGRCAGVECVDGSTYRAAKAVLSTMHIKQLVNMAPHQLWGEDFIDGVNTWQGETTECNLNLATTEPLKFAVEGGTLTPVHLSILDRPERLLRFAYDYARSAVTYDEPPMSIMVPTIADPSRAPAGMHTIKIVAYQPYTIKEGPDHWDEIKDRVADANLNYLRKFAPNLTEDKILARTVDSPRDIERMNANAWHGSCHAGAQSPSQLGAMRPMPGWAQYRMPIPGLYQTGATTHPGGSVTGAPGRNAAIVMLKDFGTTIEEVLAKSA
jgi:phytoene dehydrogenase-like protein